MKNKKERNKETTKKKEKRNKQRYKEIKKQRVDFLLYKNAKIISV